MPGRGSTGHSNIEAGPLRIAKQDFEWVTTNLWEYNKTSINRDSYSQQSKAVLPSLVNKMQRSSRDAYVYFFSLKKTFSLELDTNIKSKKWMDKKKPKTNVNWKLV